jgi:hypothetical protein
MPLDLHVERGGDPHMLALISARGHRIRVLELHDSYFRVETCFDGLDLSSLRRLHVLYSGPGIVERILNLANKSTPRDLELSFDCGTSNRMSFLEHPLLRRATRLVINTGK